MSEWDQAESIISKGGVAVLPTDTIYGLHCLASSKDSVERIYKLKGREQNKPFIILIPDKFVLKNFGVVADKDVLKELSKLWPGPNSIIFPVTGEEWDHIHRGTNSLAFRVPDFLPLYKLLQHTGPLISTSVNRSQEKPATDVETAMNYFGKDVDFYLDSGVLNKPPSNVYRIENGNFMQIR